MIAAAALVLAGTTLAAADEPAPAKPSAEEIAILRGLLGLQARQLAQPVKAEVAPPAVQVEASAPSSPKAAKPQQPSVPAPAKGAAEPDGSGSNVTSDNSYTPGASFQIARAVLAAREASQRLQLVQR